MTKSEKKVIMALCIAIFLVAAMLVFSLVKDRGSSSGNDDQAMDTVKEEMQEKSSSEDASEENTEEFSSEDSMDTSQADVSSASDTSSSTTDTAAKPGEVMNADDGYMFPDADSSYVKESEVKKLTTEQIQYAINEVYARHGLKFTKKENKERFEKKKWYTGTVDEQDDIILNKYEKKNVDIMAGELKKRGVR